MPQNRSETEMSDYSRQEGYVRHTVTGGILLAGCGSVGRQIGLALGAMGFADQLRLWDHDSIDTSNVHTQGWSFGHCGEHKAIRLAKEIQSLHGVGVNAANTARYYGQPDAEIVITALDSIDARRTIAERLAANARRGSRLQLLIDPRQSPTGCRIVAVDARREDWIEDYLSSLPPRPSHTGCVTPNTYFQSLITAGLTCRVIARYTMGLPVQCDFSVDGSPDMVDPEIFPCCSPLAAESIVIPPCPVYESIDSPRIENDTCPEMPIDSVAV